MTYALSIVFVPHMPVVNGIHPLYRAICLRLHGREALGPKSPAGNGQQRPLKKPRNASLVSHTLPLHAPALHSPHYGPELRQLLPTCSDEYTDSGNLDAVANLLYQGSDRTLSETVMMMIPEAWQNRQGDGEMDQVRFCSTWVCAFLRTLTPQPVLLGRADRSSLTLQPAPRYTVPRPHTSIQFR